MQYVSGVSLSARDQNQALGIYWESRDFHFRTILARIIHSGSGIEVAGMA